jgi:palmitoyltransferase
VFGLLTRKHPRKAGGDLLEAQLPLCPECRQSTRPNEFHCFICGVCIWRYDHHCPWINNCVSAYNLGKFTLFLLLLILATAEVLFLSLTLQTQALPAIVHNDLLPLSADTLNTIVLANLIVCGSLSLICCVLLFSVLGEQLKNLFSNSTSYERAKNVGK